MNIRKKVETLIKETLDIYKENFRLFTILSLIGALISLIYQLFVDFIHLPETINVIVIIIVGILIYYYTLRFKIALIIAIHYRFHRKDISITHSFSLSAKWFWNYFLTSLKFALLLAIPMILLVLILGTNINIIFKICGAIILGAIIFYLAVYYGFASLVSILKSRSENYFKTSKRIVSSDLYLTIVMILLGLVLGIIIYYLKGFFFSQFRIYSGVVQNLIIFSFNIFTTPLFLGLYVLLFYQLIKSNESLNETNNNTLPNNV